MAWHYKSGLEPAFLLDDDRPSHGSAEGAALYDAISFECRAFSAHSIKIANPGLAAGAIH